MSDTQKSNLILDDLLKMLDQIAIFQAKTVTEIPYVVSEEFSTIEKRISKLTSSETSQVLTKLNEIIKMIATKRDQGQSNYLFFKFIKLRKIASRYIKLYSELESSKVLELNNMLALMLEDRTRTSSKPLDFPADFLVMASSSNTQLTILPSSDYIPDSVPCLFLLNPNILTQSNKSFELALITGHCLIGTDPNGNPLLDVEAALSGGLTLQDLFVYKHVKAIAERLERAFLLKNISVNFDTDNYNQGLQDKLATLSNKVVIELVEKITFEQERIIQTIIPNSFIFRTHEGKYRKELEHIVYDGLLKFILDKTPYYNNKDLRLDPKKALNIAIIAATYLYWPIMANTPTLAIESAQNIEIPVKIALEYLKQQGKEHLFGFLGLFPLPDVKMSHGVMFYGSPRHGKLYIMHPFQELVQRIKNMSCNLEYPHKCFYTNYFISSSKSLPDQLCEPRNCQKHINAIIADLRTITDDLS